MRRRTTSGLGAALAAAVLLTAEPAKADVGGNVGAGVTISSKGEAAPAIAGTVGMGAFPIIPIRPQVTGIYSFSSGANAASYAVTGEGQFGGKSFFAGAGAGYGSILQGGFIVDAFVGVQVRRYVSAQLRYYAAPGGVGSATYLGISFGL